ncbi:hypothetical protein [Leptodesmis sichuanensis]|uniref:hypothetical protein n=1 Tax=Leptodesmis sichuanensis TaxID=2906798 RepID=UPI001F30EB3A|nr:hypothetical protein [Leptodesmis sichuanensis]UIE37363.1 hypothetical protein KIK02_20855 [Leptodesmis sichuanensis A121]
MSDNSEDKDNKWMPIATIIAAGITGLLTGGLGLKFYESWVKAVPVTIQNNDCYPADIYVDGELKMEKLSPNEAQWVIKIPPEQVKVQTCRSDNSVCGKAVDWDLTKKENRLIPIARSNDCPITVSVYNRNCEAQDYYVDNVLIAKALAPNTSVQMSLLPGIHFAKACIPGSSNCASETQINIQPDTRSLEIARGDGCPKLYLSPPNNSNQQPRLRTIIPPS